MLMGKFHCVIIISIIITLVKSQKIVDEEFARRWRDRVDEELKSSTNKAVTASWNYSTNITSHNAKLKIKSAAARRDYRVEVEKVGYAFNSENFTDKELKRWFSFLGSPRNVNASLITENAELERKMSDIYSTAKITLNLKQVSLQPELVSFMAKNRNYDQLLTVWDDWRYNTGRKMRPTFVQFVKTKNRLAKENGYKNASEQVTAVYNSKTFKEDMEKILVTLRPLYQLLHAFVLKKLKTVYGEKPFSRGLIPAHLTGNMWAQDWGNIADLVLPYPKKPRLNVTKYMVQQNYTPKRIFQLTDEFFRSLELEGVDESFYELSMLQKPTDREVVCHASAWNFVNGKDFRIKQCTDITMEDLVTAHHEMGHVQYYMQYRNLPLFFQTGANPGFHEAVGDAIALSVMTPAHMKAINLTDDYEQSNETDLNFLMQMALDKIAFLPYGFLLDKFRWELYDSEDFDNMNSLYWGMRCKYQGVYPPNYRTEKDFDAGAKYHIASDVPYIRYFFSYVFQFQLFKRMCEAAGNKNALHNCNFYKSKEAGSVLAEGLKLGSSKDWREVMKLMVNDTNLNVEPLMEYFDPLIKFLKEEVGDAVKNEWFPECPDKSFYNSSSSRLSLSSSSIIFLILIALIINLNGCL